MPGDVRDPVSTGRVIQPGNAHPIPVQPPPPATQPARRGLFSAARRHWFTRFVLIPFLLTRVALLVVAAVSQTFPTNIGYPNEDAAVRGYQYHDFWPLDVWARWDSDWYIDIMRNGYSLRGPVTEVESNIAFYPLYPGVVDAVSRPFYATVGRNGIPLLVGVTFSSLCALAGLALLYRLIIRFFGDADTAERAVLYLLAFPTAYLWSALYTESLFFFLAVAAVYAAKTGRWWLAGILAGLISITRPLGFAIALPLGILYLQSVDWKLNRIRPDILWLALAPLPLLVHILRLLPVTGDPLAIFKVQAAWHRQIAMPWTTFFANVNNDYPGINAINRVFFIVWPVLLLVAFVRRRFQAEAVLGGLFFLPSLLTGSLQSLTRFAMPIFPVFVVLAEWGRRKVFHQFVLLVFFAIQVVFFAAWVRFYWVQ